jgi:hypothetical protein
VAEHVTDNTALLEQLRQLTDFDWCWKRTGTPLAQIHRILRALANAARFTEQQVSPDSAKSTDRP